MLPHHLLDGLRVIGIQEFDPPNLVHDELPLLSTQPLHFGVACPLVSDFLEHNGFVDLATVVGEKDLPVVFLVDVLSEELLGQSVIFLAGQTVGLDEMFDLPHHIGLGVKVLGFLDLGNLSLLWSAFRGRQV